MAKAQTMEPIGKAAGNWIVAATVLGSSLVFIDSTVVSIALPVIQTAFRATTFDAQWVIEGYTLVLGALMLLCGALGDRYGRKRIFVIGVVIFAAGSILCGLAPTMPALIAARVLQGIGGTMLAPASLALLGASFEGADRGRAIGTWSGSQRRGRRNRPGCRRRDRSTILDGAGFSLSTSRSR